MNRYAALATVAQALGDFPGAQKYISQARVMASDIYDQGDIDSGTPPPPSFIFHSIFRISHFEFRILLAVN